MSQWVVALCVSMRASEKSFRKIAERRLIKKRWGMRGELATCRVRPPVPCRRRKKEKVAVCDKSFLTDAWWVSTVRLGGGDGVTKMREERRVGYL